MKYEYQINKAVQKFNRMYYNINIRKPEQLKVIIKYGNLIIKRDLKNKDLREDISSKVNLLEISL